MGARRRAVLLASVVVLFGLASCGGDAAVGDAAAVEAPSTEPGIGNGSPEGLREPEPEPEPDPSDEELLEAHLAQLLEVSPLAHGQTFETEVGWWAPFSSYIMTPDIDVIVGYALVDLDDDGEPELIVAHAFVGPIADWQGDYHDGLRVDFVVFSVADGAVAEVARAENVTSSLSQTVEFEFSLISVDVGMNVVVYYSATGAGLCVNGAWDALNVFRFSGDALEEVARLQCQAGEGCWAEPEPDNESGLGFTQLSIFDAEIDPALRYRYDERVTIGAIVVGHYWPAWPNTVCEDQPEGIPAWIEVFGRLPESNVWFP
jgi:hypothetical protein